MEQHPIPRDITGFQFKLVGSMTLKQFGYVAGGAIIGYILFKAPLGIFRLPLTFLFWFLGFALAFIPIEERPLDRWILAFLKSVYSPTQFIWKKTPVKIEVLSSSLAPKIKPSSLPQFKDSREKLERYLKSIPLPLEEELGKKEREAVSKTLSLFATSNLPFLKPIVKPSTYLKKTPQPREPISPYPAKPRPIVPPPLKVRPKEETQEKPKFKEDLLGKENFLRQKIENLQKELALKDVSRARFLELSSQLTQTLEEKRALEKKLAFFKKKVKEKKEEVVIPKVTLKEEEPRVKIITPKLAPKMGIPQVPQVPNIISGVVKDSQGGVLPGIVVSVKDKNEMTVRALKTNVLGLFASATPLPSGVYTLEIEDPKKRFIFDIIKVNLKGEVYAPLEITAKGEKEKLREELTKELFGQTSF